MKNEYFFRKDTEFRIEMKFVDKRKWGRRWPNLIQCSRWFFSIKINYIHCKQNRAFSNSFWKPENAKMLNYYSRPHICQCLTRLATVKRNSVVTISADRQKSGHQFVEDVLSLACGLLQLGLRSGDVVAISAFNRSFITSISLLLINAET